METGNQQRMSTRSGRGGSNTAAAPVTHADTSQQLHSVQPSVSNEQQQDTPSQVESHSLIQLDSGNKTKKKNSKPTVLQVSKIVNELSSSVSHIQRESGENSGRIERVEQKMDSLESKMDFLINVVTKDKESNAPASPPRKRQNYDSTVREPVQSVYQSNPPVRVDNDCLLVQESGARSHVLPPPAQLRKEENRGGILDVMYDREEYQVPTGHGKVHGMLTDGTIVKPYMYLDKEGCQNIKQKLDARPSMTALEYIQASLQLYNDTSAYDESDRMFISQHILAVATDALVRPWTGVRKWTQYVWDMIEQGRCKWKDQGFINDARVRISYTSGPATSNASAPAKSKPQEVQEHLHVVCREYNTPGGCKFHANHEVGPVKKMHICAYCDSLGRKLNHSVQKCRSKLQNQPPAQQNQFDNRGWSNPGYNQGQHNGYNSANSQQYQRNQTYNQSYSKNG